MWERYIDSDGAELRTYTKNFSWGNEKTYYNSKSNLHRLDGPAIESFNPKYHRWLIDGKFLNIYYIYG